MLPTIEGVIYFYIFVCIALLLFNLLYITRAKRARRRQTERVQKWKRELGGPPSGGPGAVRRRAKLLNRLKRTDELVAFQEVLGELALTHPERVAGLFRENRQPLCALALEYGGRPAMERAFFAYVIASFHPPIGSEHDMLVEILLGYMEHSTVYCRENVLCALYALGNEQAVEHAFELLNTEGGYHHPRLLSDGLARYTGDKGALAERLWRSRKRWGEFLLVATVQFATGLPGERFSGPFLDALTQEMLPMEVRFALVRYFQRHPFEGARPVLLDMLEEQEGRDGQLAIAAASALSAYPGHGTRQALKGALHSRSWYVRRNAALSLKALGITPDEVQEIRAGGDRYALEMLEYAAGNEEPCVPSGEARQRKAVMTV